MNSIKIYTNEVSIINNLKDINMEVVNKFPETKEEITKIKEEYANIIYIVALYLMNYKEVNNLYSVLERSAKNEESKLDFTTEGIILMNTSSELEKFDKVNMNKLVSDKSMLLNLITTIKKLAEYVDSSFMLSSFIESFNEEILFYEDMKKMTLSNIKGCLCKKLNDVLLRDKDIKLVIIACSNFLNKSAKDDLHEYIKELNNYSEVDIVELNDTKEDYVEVYCFNNKMDEIKVFTNISEIENNNELRYVKFNDSLNCSSDVYIIDDEENMDNSIISNKAETGFPIIIATNQSSTLNNINAVIPEQYIFEYLSLLEKFYSNKTIITMADYSWVTDFTRGKLIYYKKYEIEDNPKAVEDFKMDIKSEKFIGNAILFVMKEDVQTLQEYANTLDEVYPELNISCFMPRKIYGNTENYVQLFVFEE